MDRNALNALDEMIREFFYDQTNVRFSFSDVGNELFILANFGAQES